MIQVLLDSKSHQAVRHAGTEAIHYGSSPRAGQWKSIRLSDFQSDLNAEGYSLNIGDIDSLKPDRVSVLIISGRSNQLRFNENELAYIASLNESGVGIFLMANHRGFVAPQNQIAERLSLPIHFQEKTQNHLNPRFVNQEIHETSKGCTKGLQLRTACTMKIEISANDYNPVVIDDMNDNTPIAVEIDRRKNGYGRIFAITSAGHIASQDDSNSNLYGIASNAIWTMNIVKWLTKQ